MSREAKDPEMLIADAAVQESITEEQQQFFLDNGFLVIRNVLRGAELELIQSEMMKLVDQGAAGEAGTPITATAQESKAEAVS
ncbi:phytanoyl-CoA dioxygenase family protein [Paenibacillus sp. CC-CFT747]|nr:phytanoyl-CoA dioxygenase family protein [Paenibacillus sp. CC-CFT747]